MLIGFTYKNFMSFFDENVFTMRAGADTKFQDLNTFKTNYGTLLKSAIVLGANGSGKSNFINAIEHMKGIVLAELGSQIRLVAGIDTFMFSKVSREIPSVFEVEFIADGKLYQYGFELLNGEVNKEYLYKKIRRMVKVFNRISPDYHDISLSKDMDNVKELTKNTRRDTLFLHWANLGNNETAMAVYRWFDSIQIYGEDSPLVVYDPTINYIEENKDGKYNILRLLKKADANILGLDAEISEKMIDKISKITGNSRAETLSKQLIMSIETKHHVYDKEWEQVDTVSTSLQFESAGTRKLFAIAGPVIKALESGSVIFFDEIDSKLHPMLVRYLVMMFNSISDNPNNAQLICNTHDVLLLEEDIRRDQVYFTEKDGYGVSSLYSLADFKGVRKESKLLKQYLLGAFGATPRLQEHFMIVKKAQEERF